MVKKGDRRGMETLTAVVFLIVAIIVSGILILFNTDFFGTLGEYPDAAPDAFSVFLSETCNIHVNQNNQGGFCSQFFEVNDDVWSNCPYGEERYGASWDSNINCKELSPEEVKCEELQTTEGNDFEPSEVLVNGNTCAEWLSP